MKEYVQAGVNHFIVRFASYDDLGQFTAFVREVLPALP